MFSYYRVYTENKYIHLYMLTQMQIMQTCFNLLNVEIMLKA